MMMMMMNMTIVCDQHASKRGVRVGGLGVWLPYKNDGGACHTFKGFKFLDWYGLGC